MLKQSKFDVDLHNLTVKDPEWSEIGKAVFKVLGPTTSGHMTHQSPKSLGSDISEYLVESEHQSWEGWSEEEQVVITRFLNDIALSQAVKD